MLLMLMMLPVRCDSITGATCLIAQQDAPDIDRNDLIDRGGVDVDDAYHWRGDAGVVDEAIDSAKFLDRALRHRLRIVLDGDVCPNEADPKALLQRGAFLPAASGDNNLGAVRHKMFDNPFADAAGAAGNDGDFPVEHTHSCLLSRYRV